MRESGRPYRVFDELAVWRAGEGRHIPRCIAMAMGSYSPTIDNRQKPAVIHIGRSQAVVRVWKTGTAWARDNIRGKGSRPQDSSWGCARLLYARRSQALDVCALTRPCHQGWLHRLRSAEFEYAGECRSRKLPARAARARAFAVRFAARLLTSRCAYISPSSSFVHGMGVEEWGFGIARAVDVL